MRDFKNIDRLFQENLKDFEVLPPKRSWSEIEKKLTPTNNRKRFIALFKIASVAAVFILLFITGTIYFLPKQSEITFSNETRSQESENEQENVIGKISTLPKNDEKLKSETAKNSLAEERQSQFNNSESSKKETLSNNLIDEEKPTRVAVLSEKDLLKSSTNLSKKEIINSKEEEFKSLENKFTIATIYAPIYVSSFGSGSGIDSQFKNNPTSGNTSYSYGVKVAYQLNDKFSVQSGVNLINLGYKTSDVYVLSGVESLELSHISSSPFPSKVEGLTSRETPNNSLNQVFGYVEIPLEVKYNVSSGKFGINVVGGFSTLLLNRDEVFVESNTFTQSLGASNNLRAINFSGNIGIDLDYSIKKNFFINISPMFKIQANTFSKNAESIQPYYLGVYTGLNYKF